jgi:hypothetical protein
MMRNAAAVLITANTAATVFQFDGQHTVSDFATGTMVFAPLKPLPLAERRHGASDAGQ